MTCPGSGSLGLGKSSLGSSDFCNRLHKLTRILHYNVESLELASNTQGDRLVFEALMFVSEVRQLSCASLRSEISRQQTTLGCAKP